MNRRSFLQTTAMLTAGTVLLPKDMVFAKEADTSENLYRLFKNPPFGYHPYVRWWWNGNKVEKTEISRELELLKAAGIGGVEINPIQFPRRTNDMGKRSLVWLSDEWIDVLDHTLNETKRLGLTADLLVGSGWPFGAEFLQGEERAEIITIAVKKLEGLFEYEASLFDIIKIADPSIVSSYTLREPEVQKVYLVPDPMNSLDQVIDLSGQIKNGYIKASIPLGHWAVYAQVITRGFQKVLWGVPGATGPVLNHFNKDAVDKYLNHITDTIQQKIGPLKGRLRAFFTDSLEVEGANWTTDMAEEFKRRRGYDIQPYLPFTMFKTGGMGSVADYDYGVSFTDSFRDTIERIRLDFKITQAELFYERFCLSFENWCAKNGMQARVQPYGRGYHIVDGALAFDIPECETWVRPHSGTELQEAITGWGRSYDPMNKYVTSAAHLQGKRLVSCEECTNVRVVFNTTLQLLKSVSDQSLTTGVTHSVYHGFNYSPPDAPFPAWIQYGNFMNERNTYWQYFKYLNEYKARISALFQQTDFYSDIALLPCEYDAWAKLGDWLDITSRYMMQDDPMQNMVKLKYIAQLWESIHHNGNACDFVSEKIINASTMQNGAMKYGNKKYHAIFLLSLGIMDEVTANQLLEFIKSGGRIFCIDTIPSKGVGYRDREAKDKALKKVMDEIVSYKNQFIFLNRPESNYIDWFKNLQRQYDLKPYVTVDGVNSCIQQVRYSNNDLDLIFVANSNNSQSYEVTIIPNKSLLSGRIPYLWDAATGERFQLENKDSWDFTLYPSDSKLIVFENSKKIKAEAFKEVPKPQNKIQMLDTWEVEFIPINNGAVRKIKMPELKDLKDTEFVNFTGKVIYRNSFKGNAAWLDLGLVQQGLSDVKVNGKDAGVRWFGRHIYSLKNLLNNNINQLEINIVVTMGNYMKSLKDNEIAQGWVKDQSILSMGLIGPVMLF